VAEGLLGVGGSENGRIAVGIDLLRNSGTLLEIIRDYCKITRDYWRITRDYWR